MIRGEYPRPGFEREQWMNLNGTWDFRFQGEAWREITVPYVFQCKASGIGDNRMCDHVEYRRRFTVPEEWAGKRTLLHFGACDYVAEVFVNGCFFGRHEGGSAPFSFDVTDVLRPGEQEVSVQVWDPCGDEEIPRGKQYWEEHPAGIWYTRSTGIWQTVWLEPVSACSLTGCWFTPDIDSGSVKISYETAGRTEGCTLACEISMEGNPVFSGKLGLISGEGEFTAQLFGKHIFHGITHNAGWCWSPENPKLFDVTLKLERDGQTLDSVGSYFGMRKIEAREGHVWLNNRPYYQKLVLDQGYWPDTLMTAPDDEAYQKDILLSKQMGFNGCRKHQKAEDPRFLYWADRLGYLVWGEIPSCPVFSGKATQRVMREWAEILRRDYNHPSIVSWVVLNESWGVPNIAFDARQQAHSLALYYNLRSLDDTRLIVNNDGWEMTHSDLCAIHNYSHGAVEDVRQHGVFKSTLATADALVSSRTAGREMYAQGFSYEGQPILLTEFGGLAFSGKGGWGYTTIRDEAEFLREYERILTAIRDSSALRGFCYTQLTDVEQEINGLLTADRQFKVNPEAIAAINASTGT